jgi:hypothetical protein
VGYSRGTWEPGSQEIFCHRRNIYQKSRFSCLIKYEEKKLRKVIRNVFLNFSLLFKINDLKSKDIISCQRILLPVKKYYFPERKQFPVKSNGFLSKEITSCQWKLFPVREIIFCPPNISQ